jgi:integrase/recombinase XerD
MTTTLSLPSLLETFCTERLVRQQQASPHTIASDRDTFCLRWRLAQPRRHQAPSALTLADRDAPVLGSLLAYLAQARGPSARRRQVRLAAMHAFCHDAALQAPSHRGVSHRVLAMPSTRDDRTPIAFLTGAEIDALVAAPDQQTWAGRRDRTLLLVAVQTGRRVSEWIGLCGQDIPWGTGAHVRGYGQGRQVRCLPRRPDAISA